MPSPKDFKDESSWMSACMSTRKDEHPDESNEQSVAICLNIWREKSVNGGVIHKTHSDADASGMEFVLSDASPDRYGDVIEATGWDLENFKRNPIALFNHDKGFPIGKWERLSVIDGKLRGHLRMAPEGTSPRIDEIRKLIDAGILRAVSVGFLPVESKPISKNSVGQLYMKSELVETSLVAIPANPNALAIAKALKISDDVKKVVFGEHASKKDDNLKSRGLPAEHGVEKSLVKKKGTTMSPIAKRIEDAQSRLIALKDQLTEHIKTVDDENPSEEHTAVSEELGGKIEQQEKALDMLRKAESRLAATAAPAPIEKPLGDSSLDVHGTRPFAVPAKKLAPVDYLFRALTVGVRHREERGRRSMIDVLKDTYGEDAATHAMLPLISRAVTPAATTTLAGWAAELVTIAIGEFFDLLQPVSIFAALSGYGGRFEFGRNGVVTMPTRLSTTLLNGSFVGENAAIPVRQGTFSTISMTPKKLAVISTMSAEIAAHSTPAIEQLIRQAIIDDTATAVDTVLLDAGAATVVRPAAINAAPAVGIAASALGTPILDLAADIKALTNALFTATAGNVRNPVWIMTPAMKLAIQTTQAAAGGDFPFYEEISNNRLFGYPVIVSNSSTAGILYLIDAADFVTASGAPVFDVSDQATLHLGDPGVELGVGGVLGGGAGEIVRSLWQTNSTAIRMIMPCNWALRRTGMIQFSLGAVNWD